VPEFVRFELLVQKKAPKHDKKNTKGTKNRKELCCPQPFYKRFLTWAFFFYTFCGVFELPLLRNVQTHHKRKQSNLLEPKKKAPNLPTSFSGYLPDHVTSTDLGL
jgi:hypothetical protein